MTTVFQLLILSVLLTLIAALAMFLVIQMINHLPNKIESSQNPKNITINITSLMEKDGSISQLTTALAKAVTEAEPAFGSSPPDSKL